MDPSKKPGSRSPSDRPTTAFERGIRLAGYDMWNFWNRMFGDGAPRAPRRDGPFGTGARPARRGMWAELSGGLKPNGTKTSGPKHGDTRVKHIGCSWYAQIWEDPFGNYEWRCITRGPTIRPSEERDLACVQFKSRAKATAALDKYKASLVRVNAASEVIRELQK